MSLPPGWTVPLCLASLFWAFSFGVSASLAPLWMQAAGCSDSLIGLNTSVYYLGIALTAGVVPRLLRRWGSGCLLFGMAASALTASAFPWGGSLAGWFAWRVLNGAAGAASLIPLETFVNLQSPAGRRGQTFGCYAFCVALGMALGTLAGLQTYATAPRAAFLSGGAAALIGGVVILVWRPRFPAAAAEGPRRTPLDFVGNFLSFGSAWSQGFLEGGMVGLLPIYLLSVGLSQEAMSWLMSGLMVGVILAQVPVGWLADQLGGTAVLAGCNVTALLGIACMLLPGGVGWLALWLFAVGACSGAFYPLGLARLGERVPPAGQARANAWFLAINCLGSLTGPAAAGAVMDLFGRSALFVAGGSTVGLVLAIWAILGAVRRPAPAPAGRVGQEREHTRTAA